MNILKIVLAPVGERVCFCVLPADLPQFEVTLDSYRLFSAKAAEVCIIVTNITLLTFLHNLVSTDGLITH